MDDLIKKINSTIDDLNNEKFNQEKQTRKYSFSIVGLINDYLKENKYEPKVEAKESKYKSLMKVLRENIDGSIAENSRSNKKTQKIWF